MKTLMIGLAAAAAAATLGGCAIYPAYPAYGGPVVAAPAPAYVGPPVYVGPSVYFGYGGGYYGRRYRYWR